MFWTEYQHLGTWQHAIALENDLALAKYQCWSIVGNGVKIGLWPGWEGP